MECSNQHETYKYLWFKIYDNLNVLKSSLLSELLENMHVILGEFGIVKEENNVWYAKGLLKTCTKHPCHTFGRNIFRKFEKNAIYENITKDEYFKRLREPPIQQYRVQQKRRMKLKRKSSASVDVNEKNVTIVDRKVSKKNHRKSSVSSASSILSDEENDIQVIQKFIINSPVRTIFLSDQEKEIEVIDCF